MAVAIEFVNVIIRKAAVERCFPGGLDGFAREDLNNLTEDDHLLRVGFMATDEALRFVSELEAVGLRYLGPEAGSDVAVVVWDDSLVPPWLSVGHVGKYRACWASAYSPGELAWPEPGFLLRCPRAVYDSLSNVVGQCGAELHEVAISDPANLAKLCCVRRDARIMIYIVGESEGDTPVALLGRRQLERRRQFSEDVALIRDLVTVLLQAGAEDK